MQIFHKVGAEGGQEECKNVPFVFDLVLGYCSHPSLLLNLLLPKDARLHRWHRALD